MVAEDNLTCQKEYYKENHSYLDVSNTHYINNLVERVISVGNIKKTHKILEVGCGKGRFSIPLLKKGYKLTCIDLSDNLLKEFGKSVTRGMKVKITNTDINNLPKKFKGKFDRVIGFYILHHLDDLGKATVNIGSALKKGGMMIFNEPNPYNPMYYIHIIITPEMSWRGEKGILNMRKNILSHALSSAGFGDISIKRYGFFPPLVSNTEWGYKLEKMIEKIRIFYPILPFQVICAKKIK